MIPFFKSTNVVLKYTQYTRQIAQTCVFLYIHFVANHGDATAGAPNYHTCVAPRLHPMHLPWHDVCGSMKYEAESMKYEV